MESDSEIVDDLNIAELSDDELLEKLQNLGFNPGPILTTTRMVYERKLSRLLRKEHFGNLDEEAESPVGEFLAEKPSAKLSPGVWCGESSRAAFESQQRQPPGKETFVESSTTSIDPPASQRRPFMYDVAELRRRPLPRTEGLHVEGRLEGKFANSDHFLSAPPKPWSPFSMISQARPDPEGENRVSIIAKIIAVVVVALLFFALLVYHNMEPAPQNPFS